MLVFLAAKVAPLPAPRHATAQSIASARIERPAVANRKRWEHAPPTSRREMLVRDERGQPLLLRIIEYQ